MCQLLRWLERRLVPKGFLSLAVLGMALWLRRRRSLVGDGEEEKQKEIVGAV